MPPSDSSRTWNGELHDVDYLELEKLVLLALEQAAIFGLDSKAVLNHLQTVRNSL